ncbi:MAG: IclR family transcriptional regulator [Stellaceae bacterium]
MTKDQDARVAVPGLERGLNILQLFKRSRPHITPPAMARELGIPRSTVHRLAVTLEALGFLQRVDGTGAFALGPAVLTIGYEYLASLDIVQLSNPILARLHNETKLSTHLAVRHGTEIVYLSRHTQRATAISNVTVGTSLPAHATVMGRMMLADLSPAELRALYGKGPLPAYTDQTPTSLTALEALLIEDRQRGYAISTAFFERGVTAVAAPIRDRTGRVVAVINVTVVDAALDPRYLRGELKDRVLAAAAEISTLLGAPATGDNAPTRRSGELSAGGRSGRKRMEERFGPDV